MPVIHSSPREDLSDTEECLQSALHIATREGCRDQRERESSGVIYALTAIVHELHDISVSLKILAGREQDDDAYYQQSA